jgi:uncharacterized membrane protein
VAPPSRTRPTLRSHFAGSAEASDTGFRHRGTEVSRVESLSDAVFGFGITLLVMSAESPTDYSELIDNFRGIPAFAACFTLLAWLWHAHFVFCRRYGLTDSRFCVLNTVFLFVVVFYMYPLKFVFVSFFAWVLGFAQERYSLGVPAGDMSTLFVIYGLGFTVVGGLLAAMYAHAFSLRDALELDDHETAVTRHQIRQNALRALVGVACAGAAVLLPARLSGLSGFAFALLGPVESHGARSLALLRGRVAARAGSAA